MGWGSELASTALTLTGSYQTVQYSAADLVINVGDGKKASIMLDFNPQGSATEDCDVRILRSPGTTYESDGQAERIWIPYANAEGDDPARHTIEIGDCEQVKIRARVRDPDDSPGGTDTSSTLTVRWNVTS